MAPQRSEAIRATVLKRFEYSKDPLVIDYDVPGAFRHGRARVLSLTFSNTLKTINPNNEYLYLKYYAPDEPCRCVVIDLDYGYYTGELLARHITAILRKETPVNVDVTYSLDGRLVFKCRLPGCRILVPGHPGDDPHRFAEEGDVVDDRWMRKLSCSSVNDMIYRGTGEASAEVTTKQLNLDHYHVVFLHSSALGTSLGPVGEWLDCVPTEWHDTPDGTVRLRCSGDFLPIPRDGRLDFRLLDGKARGVAVGSWALLELELLRPSRATAMREAAREKMCAWAHALQDRLAGLWRGAMSTAAQICSHP
jgi:hypothetical protein